MIGLIAGPQGCGKGTQATLIEKEYGLKETSMGDLLREERAKDTEQAKQLREIMDRGDLVPNEITYRLLKNKIEELDNLLLDGFPRNMGQAEWLIENTKIDFMIIINVSEEETVKRLEKRRICTTTKKIFILDKITDEDKKECESAGGEIIQRDDDKPQAIIHRLNVYKELTEPVEKFLEEKGIPAIRVNGEHSIEEVWKNIKEKLEPLL